MWFDPMPAAGPVQHGLEKIAMVMTLAAMSGWLVFDADQPGQLDAAARVLQDAGGTMNAKQMVDAMAASGYWQSPGGKTPHATLYSAILRELQTKGDAARFVKTERGQFALRNA